MDWSKDKIYKTSISIMIDSDKLSRQEMDIKYEEFKRKYKKIYQICSSSSSALEKQAIIRELSNMLNVREEIKTGSKDEFIANIQIGEHVAKKYIYPKVGEPSLEDKKRAIDKLANKRN